MTYLIESASIDTSEGMHRLSWQVTQQPEGHEFGGKWCLYPRSLLNAVEENAYPYDKIGTPLAATWEDSKAIVESILAGQNLKIVSVHEYHRAA